MTGGGPTVSNGPVETRDRIRREEVLARLGTALDDGSVGIRDVERLLDRRRARRGRPGAAEVLGTLGAVVVLCGLAIAFATVFDDLPTALQIIGPFAFPAAAAGGCVWLARRGAARWQTDLLGIVAYGAFGGACVASAWGSGLVDTGRGAAGYALVAAVPAVAMVALLHATTGSPLLLWTGGPAIGIALVVASAELTGILSAATLPWVVLTAGAAAAAAGVLLLRRGRADGRIAFLWATACGVAAVLTSPDDLSHFRVWHVVLAAVVVAAFLAGAALDFPPLIWLAAAGGALWVVLIAVVVGSATGAALAVVLAGLGLVGLGLLVARLHRPRAGTPR